MVILVVVVKYGSSDGGKNFFVGASNSNNKKSQHKGCGPKDNVTTGKKRPVKLYLEFCKKCQEYLYLSWNCPKCLFHMNNQIYLVGPMTFVERIFKIKWNIRKHLQKVHQDLFTRLGNPHNTRSRGRVWRDPKCLTQQHLRSARPYLTRLLNGESS